MTDYSNRIMYLKEAAKYVGKAPFTLQSWDRAGKLKAHRTDTNRRYYYQAELDAYLGIKHDEHDHRKTVAYARVSSSGQKDDLQDQVAFLRQFINAKGIIADEFIADIGSGLNYKRPKWLKLIKEIDQNRVKEVYVTYKIVSLDLALSSFKNFVLGTTARLSC